jgi:hypothetical protein
VPDTVKILLTLDETTKARMVNTLDWTRPHTGIPSQQQFIRHAIEQLCDDLEKRYNNGQPFTESAAKRQEPQ